MLTFEESKLFYSVIDENEEYRLIADKLESYLEHKEYARLNPDQLDNIWNRIDIVERDSIKEKFNYAKPKTGLFAYTNFLKVAVALIILMGTGLLTYNLLNHPNDQQLETVIATNKKTFRMLDDGTKIWLNKNSTFSYNKTFGKDKREITLTGEAYFDVARNTAIPLFIHAGDIDIEVKGTAFNVNAYKDSPIIQVALVRGLIQITDRSDLKRKVLLHPSEKLTLTTSKNNEQHKFFISAMRSETLFNDTKWKADTLSFNKERLKDLVVRMEKKFDLKIEIRSEKLKETRFSGTFINENIQQALEALKLSYPLSYTISNRLVVIKEDK